MSDPAAQSHAPAIAGLEHTAPPDGAGTLARVTRTLRMVNTSNQALIHASDEQQLLHEICRIAVEVGGYKLAWVGYAERDGERSVRPVALGGAPADYVAKAQVSWGDNPKGHGPTGACIREGRTVIGRDFTTDPQLAPWRADAAEAGFRSSIALPLRDGGAVFGAFTIYADEPDAFDAEEAHLLEDLAADLACGVNALRARAAAEAATAEVRRSEARYRSLVEALDDGLVEVDGEHKITFANDQFARMLGRAPEDLIGRRSLEFVSEPDQQGMRRRSERPDAPRDERYELTWLRADGAPIPSLVSVRRQFDSARRYIGAISVVTDLTKLKALQASTQHLADIVENAQDGIVGEDRRGIITSWNKGAERIYGFTAAEMIGRRIDVLVPPDRAGENSDLRDRVLKGEAVAQVETERLNAAGERLDVSITISPIRDFTGQIIGVSRIFRDITELKRAEKEREQYLKFFQLSADAMAIADPFGCFKRVNPAFLAITGYDEHELLSRPYLQFVAPEDRPRTAEEMRLQVAKRPSMEFENRYLRKDGSKVDLSWNAYFDKTDRVTYATARDVTERNKVQKELDRQRQHLEEMVEARTSELTAANTELESFAYSVSHDLRAPLRAVDGFSQILVEDYAGKLDAEGQHLVAVIRESAQKMGQMIDDILTFSRAGRLELKAEPVDMAKLVTSVWDELQGSRGERTIQFEVAELPAAHGDAAMLQRVWQNLLDNAIKYTGPKSDARVVVGAEPGERETIYFVRDNGVGFDMTYVDKLWGVFQRLHGAEFPGSGIGLAIVKKIVTRHGGRVWAQGKVGEGATFYFALPAGKDLNE